MRSPDEFHYVSIGQTPEVSLERSTWLARELRALAVVAVGLGVGGSKVGFVRHRDPIGSGDLLPRSKNRLASHYDHLLLAGHLTKQHVSDDATPRVEFGGVGWEVPAVSDALWVVDGQRRVASLTLAVSGERFSVTDTRFSVLFDPLTEEFVSVEGNRRSLRAMLPVETAFDLAKVLDWASENDVTGEARDRVLRPSQATPRLQRTRLPHRR